MCFRMCAAPAQHRHQDLRFPGTDKRVAATLRNSTTATRWTSTSTTATPPCRPPTPVPARNRRRAWNPARLGPDQHAHGRLLPPDPPALGTRAGFRPVGGRVVRGGWVVEESEDYGVTGLRHGRGLMSDLTGRISTRSGHFLTQPNPENFQSSMRLLVHRRLVAPAPSPPWLSCVPLQGEALHERVRRGCNSH